MKVLLADDHPLFLDGLRTLLETHGIEVVGTARNGREAVEKARALRPGIVLMDIQMPEVNGLEALRLIQAELPETKVVMLTISADDESLFQAVKSGASGYLLKTQETDDFFELLRDVESGGSALSPGLAGRILMEMTRSEDKSPPKGGTDMQGNLSVREIEVLALVAQGLTYKEVGARLQLSERTIKYHMVEIVEHLHLENRREAIESARRAGLV